MRTILSYIILSLSMYIASAQPCDFPLPPSNTCDEAPLLCDLDAYCSNNSAATNSGTPNAFCGQVENNNWVRFIAGSEEFVLEITVSNCNQGSGIQAQIFSTADCNFFTSVSNCVDGVNTSGTVNAVNLTIGNIYYLMIDGKNGDVCDYTFHVISGTILSPTDVSIEQENVLCENSTSNLKANVIGASDNLSFEWSSTNGNILTDNSNSSIEIDASGTYWVKVQDINGCSDSTSIEVELNAVPTISIATPDTINCLSNMTIRLQANSDIAPASFAWSTNDGNIISDANTAMPLIDAPGLYQVTVTNPSSTCTSTSSIPVFRDIQTPISIAGSDGELNCLNPSLSLDGSGSSTGHNFVYLWTSSPPGNIISGANTLMPLIEQPGIYTLQVTNLVNDCVDTDVVNISLNDAVPSGALFTLKQACYGEQTGSIQINSVEGGSPPFQYSFDGNSFQSSAAKNDLAKGDYIITIKDATGCEWDTTLSIVELEPLLLDFGKESLSIFLGDEIHLNAQTNIPFQQIDHASWQPPYPDCTDCLSRQAIPLQTSTYQLSLKDINGCTANAEIIVFVDKKRNVYIPNAFSPNGDGANDLFSINAGKGIVQIKHFKIFDRWGGLVYEAKDFQPNDATYGWDGRKQGKLLGKATYTYFAEIEFIDNEVILYHGSVHLLR